jgi:hypothetical protein
MTQCRGCQHTCFILVLPFQHTVGTATACVELLHAALAFLCAHCAGHCAVLRTAGAAAECPHSRRNSLMGDVAGLWALAGHCTSKALLQAAVWFEQ